MNFDMVEAQPFIFGLILPPHMLLGTLLLP